MVREKRVVIHKHTLYFIRLNKISIYSPNLISFFVWFICVWLILMFLCPFSFDIFCRKKMALQFIIFLMLSILCYIWFGLSFWFYPLTHNKFQKLNGKWCHNLSPLWWQYVDRCSIFMYMKNDKIKLRTNKVNKRNIINSQQKRDKTDLSNCLDYLFFHRQCVL